MQMVWFYSCASTLYIGQSSEERDKFIFFYSHTEIEAEAHFFSSRETQRERERFVFYART
jgi:hypothetical protein